MPNGRMIFEASDAATQAQSASTGAFGGGPPLDKNAA
jgi:hypothetical protein